VHLCCLTVLLYYWFTVIYLCTLWANKWKWNESRLFTDQTYQFTYHKRLFDPSACNWLFRRHFPPLAFQFFLPKLKSHLYSDYCSALSMSAIQLYVYLLYLLTYQHYKNTTSCHPTIHEWYSVYSSCVKVVFTSASLQSYVERSRPIVIAIQSVLWQVLERKIFKKTYKNIMQTRPFYTGKRFLYHFV